MGNTSNMPFHNEFKKTARKTPQCSELDHKRFSQCAWFMQAEPAETSIIQIHKDDKEYSSQSVLVNQQIYAQALKNQIESFASFKQGMEYVPIFDIKQKQKSSSNGLFSPILGSCFGNFLAGGVSAALALPLYRNLQNSSIQNTATVSYQKYLPYSQFVTTHQLINRNCLPQQVFDFVNAFGIDSLSNPTSTINAWLQPNKEKASIFRKKRQLNDSEYILKQRLQGNISKVSSIPFKGFLISEGQSLLVHELKDPLYSTIRQKTKSQSIIEKHTRNLSSIDILNFGYSRVGQMKMLESKKGDYFGAITTEWMPQGSIINQKDSREKNHLVVPAKQIVHSFYNEQLYDGDQTYENKPLFDPLYIGIMGVKNIQVSFQSNDQGWGNQKGEVFLQVSMRGKVVKTYSISDGLVPHQRTLINFNKGQNQLQSQIQPGSRLQFVYRNGGGNGHQIYIYNFKAQITLVQRLPKEITSNLVKNSLQKSQGISQDTNLHKLQVKPLAQSMFKKGESGEIIFIQDIPIGTNFLQQVRVTINRQDQLDNIFVRIIDTKSEMIHEERLIFTLNTFSQPFFQSRLLGHKVPIGGIMRFIIKKQDKNAIKINSFKAQLLFSDKPKSHKTVYGLSSPCKDIVCPIVSNVQSIFVSIIPDGAIQQKIVMQIYDSSNKLKESMSLFQPKQQNFMVFLQSELLKSKLAIGDAIKIVNKQTQNSKKLKKIEFSLNYQPFQIPDFRVIATQFSNFQLNNSNKNLILQQNYSISFSGRLYGLVASCTWKTNDSKSSQGKLYLVHKRENKEINRYDLFAKACDKWSHALTRLDSSCQLVKSFKGGDSLSIEGQVSEKQVVYVDNLEIVAICQKTS